MDLIIEGSVVELRDASDPFLYWPARVIQNVGGRLQLRYAGLSDKHQTQDTWMFYLDVRLRPLGWAQENKLTLEPPTGDNLIYTLKLLWRNLNVAKLNYRLSNILNEQVSCFPSFISSDLFQVFFRNTEAISGCFSKPTSSILAVNLEYIHNDA